MQRTRLLLLAVAVGGLLLPTVPLSPGHFGGAVPPLGAGFDPAAVRALPPVLGPSSPLLGLNQTLAESLLGAPDAAVPTSALPVTPPVVPPATAPVVMTFLTASQTCCVSANYTAPFGTWGLVEIRYTGQAVGGVYDSSFRAYIDQVQVLFGTTPEYGEWNVTQDVTRYVSLLNGTFNFTFLLSAALAGGYFLTSISLWFYPLPSGAAAPEEPTVVVPILHRVFVSTSTPTLSANATVPANAVNATLEVWTYGFNPDEFWYAQKPTFRELCVSVDGTGLAVVPPFPYINTGGNDLFAWRPITGAFTLDNPAYEVDVSGALGLLEGAHTYTANVTGVSSGSDWLVGAALIVYTSSTAGPATAVSHHFSDPTPVSVSTSTSLSQSQSASWSYSSSWWASTATISATTFGNATFQSQIAQSGPWSNLSVTESLGVHSRWSDGAFNTSDLTDAYRFLGGMDLGGSFTETSNTGGGYPIYGNFTTDFIGAQQDWKWSHSLAVRAGSAYENATSTVDHGVQGGSNVFGGTEELTSATAALLLSITFIESATTDAYRAASSGAGPSWTWDHFVGGSAYQPTPPDDAETIYLNEVVSPVEVALSASPSAVDVGQVLELRASVAGGTPPYAYSYTGLPAGCDSQDAASLSCAPSSSGVALVRVTAVDSLGFPAGSSDVMVEVAPTLTAQLLWNRSLAEIGETVSASLVVVGGVGPYVCRWTLPSEAPATLPCDEGVPVTAGQTGPEEVNVTVVDATGSAVIVNSSLPVVSGPLISLWPTPTLPLYIGAVWTVVANVSGGIAPYLVAWYVNGIEMSVGTNLTYRAQYNRTGNETITAAVTDSAGGSSESPPLTLAIAPSPSAGPGGGGSTSSEGSTNSALLLGLALGAVLGGAAGAGVLFALRRRPPNTALRR